MNLYVYYDVPLATCADVASTIRAMQATLTDHAQRVALLRRPEQKAALQPAVQTWMEIYEDVADGFDERLARAVADHPVTTGPRHVERFVPVD